MSELPREADQFGRRVAMYSKRELLNWLWELGDGRESPPDKADLLDHEDAPSPGTYDYRFESWAEALRQAGYSETVAARFEESDKPELIRTLREAADVLGRTPTKELMRELESFPSPGPFQDRFETWNNALREAGFEPNKIQDGDREYTNQQLLGHLRRVADELGHQPSWQEMEDSDGPKPRTYARRFDSWSKAKEIAFNDDE